MKPLLWTILLLYAAILGTRLLEFRISNAIGDTTETRWNLTGVLKYSALYAVVATTVFWWTKKLWGKN